VRQLRLPACVGLSWACACQGAVILPIGCSRETNSELVSKYSTYS
jgi:hypothetical protein